MLKGLLDHKKIEVLKLLYLTKGEMYLREIAKKSGVSVSSVFRILGDLEKAGIVKVREVGMMKFFSLAREGKGGFLEDWFKEEGPWGSFREEIKKIQGLKKALLYGKMEKDQGSVILIGEGIDEGEVDKICERMREKGLNVSYAAFSEKQFERVDKMGLYGGERKVLVG